MEPYDSAVYEDDVLILHPDVPSRELPGIHIQTDHVYQGNYIIASLQWPWPERSNIYVEVCYWIICFCITSLACTPYLVYNEFLPSIEWGIICPGRFVLYFFIFSAYLIQQCNNYKQQTRHLLRDSIRNIFISLFSLLYATLYSIKWFELQDLPTSYIGVVTFFFCWFVVYHQVASKHYLSSNLHYKNISNLKIRNAMIQSIKKLEEILWHNTEATKFLSSNSKNDLLYYAKIVNTYFESNTASKLKFYEEDGYSSFESCRIGTVNFILGMATVPLALSLMEDYAHSLHEIISNIKVFPWLIAILSAVLSVLYIIATHPIYHKFIRCKSHHSYISYILPCIVGIPKIFSSMILSSIRINASYAIFGRIAAKMGFPIELGVTFIWSGIIIVFLIDFCSNMKILSVAIKFWTTKIANLLLIYSPTNHYFLYLSQRGKLREWRYNIYSMTEDEVEDHLNSIL